MAVVVTVGTENEIVIILDRLRHLELNRLVAEKRHAAHFFKRGRVKGKHAEVLIVTRADEFAVFNAFKLRKRMTLIRDRNGKSTV